MCSSLGQVLHTGGKVNAYRILDGKLKKTREHLEKLEVLYMGG
jgi:hypothetical protein